MSSVRRLTSALRRIVNGPHRRSQLMERLRDRCVLLDVEIMRLSRTGRTRAIAFGFSYEKRRLLRRLYPDRRFVFAPSTLDARVAKRLLRAGPELEFWSWSFVDASVEEALGGEKRSWTRVEDGFIRSNGLGVHGAAPRSFCVDRSGLYFDATQPSDLENLCLAFDGQAQIDLVRRAERLMTLLIRHGVTKYGTNSPHSYPLPFGSVLVLGQVEDDASIRRNPQGMATNQALVERALAENDPGIVYYRPHPDVAAGIRRRQSEPEKLVAPNNVISANVPISDLLDKAAHVYTISSLGGFEALIRGVKVSTFGAPFYAGWGLTRDHLSFSRRNRTLRIEELFACAYILYPIYFDPWKGERVQIEDTISSLRERDFR